MVCDGGMIASTVASLMMNGLCCVWQMQEEDDRREAIRKSFRVELDRQRKLEWEMYEQHHNEQIENYMKQKEQLERRQNLLRKKRIAEGKLPDDHSEVTSGAVFHLAETVPPYPYKPMRRRSRMDSTSTIATENTSLFDSDESFVDVLL